jgi:nucleoside-diphosphate-sugar epimerase
MTHPILVTGAAGRVGGVGGLVVEALRRRGLPVRALVRREDERAEALRGTGAEVVVGDLTRPADVGRAPTTRPARPRVYHCSASGAGREITDCTLRS